MFILLLADYLTDSAEENEKTQNLLFFVHSVLSLVL